MKDYDIVITSVKNKLKNHSKNYTMGYIYALLDWRVISLETFEKLKDFVEKEEIDKWFYNLEDNIKEEIMDVIFPNDIIYNSDDSWKRLDWKIKLEVYRENNPEKGEE